MSRINTRKYLVLLRFVIGFFVSITTHLDKTLKKE